MPPVTGSSQQLRLRIVVPEDDNLAQPLPSASRSMPDSSRLIVDAISDSSGSRAGRHKAKEFGDHGPARPSRITADQRASLCNEVQRRRAQTCVGGGNPTVIVWPWGPVSATALFQRRHAACGFDDLTPRSAASSGVIASWFPLPEGQPVCLKRIGRYDPDVGVRLRDQASGHANTSEAHYHDFLAFSRLADVDDRAATGAMRLTNSCSRSSSDTPISQSCRSRSQRSGPGRPLRPDRS
jgi:hypothetical protein